MEKMKKKKKEKKKKEIQEKKKRYCVCFIADNIRPDTETKQFTTKNYYFQHCMSVHIILTQYLLKNDHFAEQRIGFLQLFQ